MLEQWWAVSYLMHGIHQFGEVIEALWAGHHPFLLQVDGVGELPDVVLSHLLKLGLAFQPLKWYWEGNMPISLQNMTIQLFPQGKVNIVSCHAETDHKKQRLANRYFSKGSVQAPVYQKYVFLLLKVNVKLVQQLLLYMTFSGSRSSHIVQHNSHFVYFSVWSQ